MKTTSSERRLHPVSVVFETGRWLPRFLAPLIVLVIAARQASAALVLWMAAVGMVLVIVSVVRYLRFSYRYDPAELVIRSGLFTRNERIIPYVRIQNLDAAQNPLHRLLDVAVVHVQTGGSVAPEASLRVLPVTALHEMRERVLAAGGRAGAAVGGSDEASASVEAGPSGNAASLDAAGWRADHTRPRTLLALTPRDLFLAGFIENRGMVLIFSALAVLEQGGVIGRVTERLFQAEDAALTDVAARWLGGTEVPVVQGALYVTGALLAILLFIRLLSTFWAVIRLYGFRLERIGDELHAEYGLFTRVSATIPLRRVQTVIVRDGVLHRLLGRRAVVVETAGGLAMDTGAPQREPIAPILRAEQLPALLEELQPGLELGGIDWQPVHARAFGRMLRGSLVGPAALSLAAFLLVREWALAVFAVLLVRALFRARLRARHLAWSLTRDSIVVRDGALTRDVRIARFNRVQVVALGRNPFDLRTGMARVRADTAGLRGGVVVPFLPESTASALHNELTSRTAATAFTW